jgi:hypothetical protein
VPIAAILPPRTPRSATKESAAVAIMPPRMRRSKSEMTGYSTLKKRR